MPLSRVELRQSLAERYADLLPEMSWEEMRRMRGRQELIVLYEPELSLETLPTLLADATDRERFLTLLERVVADPDTPEPMAEQLAMLERIRSVLGEPPKRPMPKKLRTGRTSKKTT